MNNPIDNKTEADETSQQNSNDGEPLTWPITNDLIGRKVRFDGYVTGKYKHWIYETGNEYLIKIDAYGNIGPAETGVSIPPKNCHNDFKFTLLPENNDQYKTENITDTSVPDGYYYDDEEDKLKPLKTETFVRYDVSNALFTPPAPDKVELPRHYPTSENGKKPAMPIEFSGFAYATPESHSGLTKREMFAMHAMQEHDQ